MNYFVDIQYIEKKVTNTFLGITFGFPYKILEPISINIDSEDNGFYVICKEFDIDYAWYVNKIDNYYPIRESILKNIFEYLNKLHGYNEKKLKFTKRNLKYLVNKYGHTKKHISKVIKNFIFEDIKKQAISNNFQESKFYTNNNSSYQYVVFCQLFNYENKPSFYLPKEFITLK